VVSKNFDPAMGFVSRSDVIGTTPGVFWYYRGKKLPFKKWVRAFEPGLLVEIYHQASTGKLIERQVDINPIWFNFQGGGYLGYLVIPTFERLTEPFAPLGIVISEGTYNFTRNQIFLSTDPSKILGLNCTYETGSYFNGKLNSVNISLRFSPVPHFSMTGQLNRNQFKKVGVNEESITADLFTISGRLALNPRLQLTGFYQKNTQSDLSNYNIRLSWEYQPLSFIYFVFNHRGFENMDMKRQTEDHIIFKISYLRQL
jgi:hypothetical protein